ASTLTGEYPDLLHRLGLEPLALAGDLERGAFAVPLRQRHQKPAARTKRPKPERMRLREAGMNDDHVGGFADVLASVAMDDRDVAIGAKISRGARCKPLVAFDCLHPALGAHDLG